MSSSVRPQDLDRDDGAVGRILARWTTPWRSLAQLLEQAIPAQAGDGLIEDECSRSEGIDRSIRLWPIARVSSIARGSRPASSSFPWRPSERAARRAALELRARSAARPDRRRAGRGPDPPATRRRQDQLQGPCGRTDRFGLSTARRGVSQAVEVGRSGRGQIAACRSSLSRERRWPRRSAAGKPTAAPVKSSFGWSCRPRAPDRDQAGRGAVPVDELPSRHRPRHGSARWPHDGFWARWLAPTRRASSRRPIP